MIPTGTWRIDASSVANCPAQSGASSPSTYILPITP
jgi:hypothetical protein